MQTMLQESVGVSDDGSMAGRGQGEGRRTAASNGRGKPTATTSEAPRWHSATRVQSEYKGRDRSLVPMKLFLFANRGCIITERQGYRAKVTGAAAMMVRQPYWTVSACCSSADTRASKGNGVAL